MRSATARSAMVIATLVAQAGLGACASTPASPAPSADADREQILARIDQFHESIRDGDPERYADVFVPDFVFTWSRNGQIYDREMILPHVVPTPEFAPLVDETILRLYGDAAIVNFRVRKAEGDDGVRVTFSCARVNGSWKVLASHSTPIVPPDETDGDAD